MYIVAGSDFLFLYIMINREMGKSFGFSGLITPEHINQALTRTHRDTSNEAFIGVLRSIVQPKQESKPEPKPETRSQKEIQHDLAMQAKADRERWNRENRIGFIKR